MALFSKRNELLAWVKGILDRYHVMESKREGGGMVVYNKWSFTSDGRVGSAARAEAGGVQFGQAEFV